jgi:uncharacterized protein YecE (DUF72 family)
VARPELIARDEEGPRLGSVLALGGSRVYTGTCSWTDKTLTDETDWYPQRTMSAADRLAFYASRFALVEVDATYYAPPREQQTALWAQRTPPGFRFDVKAYSLLTGHPTKPGSLWPDLRELLSPEDAAKRAVYAGALPPDAVEEAWRRFEAALRPLHEAGRLGAVLMQYPPWFGPRREARAELRALRERLPDYRVCVEFRSARWLAEPQDAERTLGLLEECGLAYVVVDAPAVSGLRRTVAATSEDLAVMRFHGRADATWKKAGISAAERFRYDYAEEELAALAGEAAELAASARETHLLMNNCYRDYAVRNARRLGELLEARS